MTKYQIPSFYPTPLPDIRKRYRWHTEPTKSGGVLVTVFRLNDDGAEKQVAQYERNYVMYKTFEPFAQRQGNEWHDYALISHDYDRLAVLDLESGEIIAEEQSPKVTEEMAKRSYGRLKEGDDAPGAGFCPTEFYVPNWWDEYEESDIPTPEQLAVEPGSKAESYLLTELKQMSRFEGQWGVYAGCVWGDDSSWKIQYVDLSRISEGIVTTDNRFGYLALPYQGKLSDHVFLHPSLEDSILISTPIQYDMTQQRAVHKQWTVGMINWEETGR